MHPTYDPLIKILAIRYEEQTETFTVWCAYFGQRRDEVQAREGQWEGISAQTFLSSWSSDETLLAAAVA